MNGKKNCRVKINTFNQPTNKQKIYKTKIKDRNWNNRTNLTLQLEASSNDL